VSGAHEIEVLREMLRDIGFVDVEIRVKDASKEYISEWMPHAEEYVVAAEITARKPGSMAFAVTSALKRAGRVARSAWLAQAKHHAAHCDSNEDEEPECAAASAIVSKPNPQPEPEAHKSC